MISVLVCTHGNSATELVKSAEMICGSQDNCKTVKFTMGQSLDNLREELDKKINSLKGTVIYLTDLKRGTPFNTLVTLKEKYTDMEIITGVNIPMLLQLFLYRDQSDKEELMTSTVETAKSGVYRYQLSSSSDEEDF